MKLTNSQIPTLLLSFLLLGSSFVNAEYQPYTNTKQDVKQQKIKKKQQKQEEKKDNKEMKKKGMKQKVKSYGEVVLENAEILNLTDEQLGKIMRIQMTNKKARKELLDQPHKSMKKALKALRDPSKSIASIRLAGRTHTDDFDILVEAEIASRNKIDAALTPKQRKILKLIKLPQDEMGD